MTGSYSPEPSRPAPPEQAAEGELHRALAVAQALLDEGRAQEALEQLRALTERHPHHAPAHNKLGICLARLGRLEEAAEAFQRAAELDPAYPAPWSNLGNVHLQQGRLDQAEAAYRKALAIDPGYAPAHNNLAAALRRMGRYDEAVYHLKQSVRLQRDRPEGGPVSASGRWLFYGVLGALALLYWLWRQRAALAVAAALAGLAWGAGSGATAQASPARLVAEPVTVEAGPVRLELVPAALGFRFEAAEPAQPLLEGGRARPGPGEPQRLVGPDPAAFERLVARLDRMLGQAPVEPRMFFEPDGRGVIVPGRAGRRVDRQALEAALRAAVASPEARVVSVPLVSVPPALSEGELAPLATARLLAVYTTRYDPGEVGRSVNIATAARELDGLVLRPGGAFSFNEAVGPRITERGYREAPVLLAGRLAEDVGGGVCQVSTTLYNAALLGGLKVTRRAPHSRPVWYVALARDAAVAYGLIDLKLQNPNPYPVAVSARAEAGELTVRLWAPEGALALPWQLRTVVEQAIPGEVELIEDLSLAPSERSVEEAGRTGYVATLWRELPLYGPIVGRERVNRSFYPPAPARVRVGRQEKAAGE